MGTVDQNGIHANAQRIAKALMERGITKDRTTEQAAAAYRAFLNEQIASHGGDVDGAYAQRINDEVSVLQQFYDEKVKPQFNSPGESKP